MYTISYHVGLMLILTGPIIPEPSGIEDHAEWRKRFEEEARAAWLDYMDRAKSLQGSVLATIEEISPTERPWLEVEIIVKQAPRRALVRYNTKRRQGDPNPEQTVRVSNPLYAFELERDGPADRWVISDLDLDLTDGLSLDPKPEVEVERVTHYPISLIGVNPRFQSVMLEPGFQAKRITPIEQDGQTLVRVEFDYQPSDGDKTRALELSGWIVYDPERFWVIREFDINIINPKAESPVQVQQTGTYMYRDTENGFPLLQQAELTLDNIGAQAKYVETREFNMHFNDVRRNDFHLTAFGFPEPNDVVRPTPWFLYSLIAGVALLVIAFALYKWAARPASRGA